MVYYKGKLVEFETLPINEQHFRLAIFLETNAYKRKISKKHIMEIASEYGVDVDDSRIVKYVSEIK